MTWRVWRIALLLLCSGTCALVYQTAWFREMRLVFGMSTAASAAVLAIFMGGLGLGGVLLGRLADRHPRPLALYGMLEVGIALSAAATPFMIGLVRVAYLAAGGTPEMGLGLGTVVRLLLSALVLAVPTVLMGGTLPAAARAAETEDDAGRRNLALLYGMNTFGAVTGTALSTLVLLEFLGNRGMLWVAAGVNLAVGLAAVLIGRREPALAAGAAVAAGTDPAGASSPSAAPAPVARPFRRDEPPTPRAFALAAAFVVGFAFLLMELVWYRMLAPLLGGSSYTFGLILAVALLGIGLGGAVASLLSRDRPPTLAGFALTCSLEAVMLAIPFALGDRVALGALFLRSLGTLGFQAQVLAWAAIASVVVLPAAFVAGVQFPLLIGLLGRGRHGVGRDTGAAYAWNTGGAILGSLAGGFGLLPLLTATGAWRLAAGVLAALGVAAAVTAAWLGGRLRFPGIAGVAAPLLAGLAVLALTADGPTAAWRHSAIGAGRSRVSDTTGNGVREWLNGRRRDIRWSADGVESSIGLSGSDGWSFLVAGKSDGNARGDAPTQVMGGLVGALLHPEPKTAFVVGLGTGSTAGWLAAVPSIERVDVAELEPAVVEVARYCAPVNHDALDDPKLSVFLGDAREALLASSRTYDIVFSEPSNPFRAGISSLFTLEFYVAARARLSEGGIFLQWLQAYEVDAATVRTVIATLARVFDSVETWRTKGGDLLLVASRAPIPLDVPRLRERVATEPFRSAALATWRAVTLEDVLAHFVARDSLARTIAAWEGDALNTDDMNLVEFGFARTLGRKYFDVDELIGTARTRGEHRPLLAGGEVDWVRVEDAAAIASVADDTSPDSPDWLTAPQRFRVQALSAFLDGDLPGVLTAWRAQDRAPENPIEVAAVAEATAEAGDPGAVALAERLREWEPAEADLVLARLAARQGRDGEAADLLVAAFERFRTDPWPLPAMMRRSLSLASEVAGRDKAAGARIVSALAHPFSVSNLDDLRAQTAAGIATSVGEPLPCADLYGVLEPHVPWRLAFLKARAECYARTEDLRVVAAVAELMEFLAAEPMEFGAGL
ncbi:MAG: fused MFS/spermidine synthase [Deltaproteobacteria bacterium]|nr:fused MFS/spermidine synthase [Deltaproteobacteria bacterium]